MEWSELKRRRGAAIQSMQSTLDHTEPLSLNPVLVFLLGLPVLLWHMVTGAILILISTLVGTLVSVFKIVSGPFLALYLIIDLFLIGLWYLKAVAVKSGK